MYPLLLLYTTILEVVVTTRHTTDPNEAQTVTRLIYLLYAIPRWLGYFIKGIPDPVARPIRIQAHAKRKYLRCIEKVVMPRWPDVRSTILDSREEASQQTL